jgi:hypothetical protein
VSATESNGPCGEAARVREEIVASTLCWVIAQGCNRRRVLIQWVVRRNADAESEDGSAMWSRECIAEKTSMEAESSSEVSGSIVC